MPKKHVSPAECEQRYPRISTPSTPQRKEFSAHSPPPTPSVRPPPPSSYCWRYSRWPCHSRPCVPSGILSCPQQAVPRSLQLLAIYLHTNPHSLTKHWTTRFYITTLCGVKKTHIHKWISPRSPTCGTVNCDMGSINSFIAQH